MDSAPAFVALSSFVGVPRRHAPLQSRRRPGARAPTAVLDTPASNTYLQRHAEVTLRNFLTRRAVNTVMYYMHELGDSFNRNWLRTFDDFSHKVEQDRFVDADDYLQRMMRADKEEKTIQVSYMGGRLVRSYNVVIEPYRIANRIFAIRKQLSGEWATDLRCIRMENLEIQRMAVESMLCSSEAELQSKRNLIFDSDPFSNDNTPLRYKNYHALKTLTTRHAVSRLLPYIRDVGPNHDYMYLLQFCRAYGSIDDGDDFVKKLMARPIESRTHPSHLIQPRGLALQLLELRWAIAEEWIAIMKYIPEEHILMNRSILERSVMMDVDMGRGEQHADEAA